MFVLSPTVIPRTKSFYHTPDSVLETKFQFLHCLRLELRNCVILIAMPFRRYEVEVAAFMLRALGLYVKNSDIFVE